MLKTGVREHKMPSSYSNIDLHILKCEKYINKAQLLIDRNLQNFTSLAKAKFVSFNNRCKL